MCKGSLDEVASRNLKFMGDVLHRLARLVSDGDALKLAERAWREAKLRSAKASFDFLSKSRKELALVLDAHLRRTGSMDLFDIGSATNGLWTSLSAGKLDDAATALNALVERLDAHLSYAVSEKKLGKR